MEIYQDLLRKIIHTGVEKESGRENMPNTIGISQAFMKFNMNDGFPLLTTKKMFLKGIICELLWFMRGQTNIKPLLDDGVNIWNKDAYRWYLKKLHKTRKPLTIQEFIDTIKEMPHFEIHDNEQYDLGDLGKVYGYQWRNQNGIDQLANVIDGLKANPYSRYHIIDAWNKADFDEMALPPCHLLYQFIVRPIQNQSKEKKIIDRKFYLDLNMYQRSCDTFLGVPFNIASASLLLMIIAKTCNMVPGVFTWLGGDTHLYTTHGDQVMTQLKRNPKALPKLLITKDLYTLQDIESLTYKDFELTGYNPHPAIKAELSVGL